MNQEHSLIKYGYLAPQNADVRHRVDRRVKVNILTLNACNENLREVYEKKLISIFLALPTEGMQP